MFHFFSMKSKNPEEKRSRQEFSKILLIQESLLIWVYSLGMLILAYICVFNQFYAELPWLTAMVALPWSAYAVSQHAYYAKARAENTEKGIRYETVMAQYNNQGEPQEADPMDEPPVG